MLLLLAEYLQQFYKGFGVFQYLTLRGILSVLTALSLSLWLGPWMIRTLQIRQIGQAVRNDGPQSHLSKKGTLTMGGALILTAIAISTLLWADLSNRYVWVVLVVTLLFGAIGWVDDYRKVIEKNSRGLPSRWKYFWQSVFGIGAAVFLYMTAETPIETTPDRADAEERRDPVGHLLRGPDLLRHRRLEQCGEPHRRSRRPGDHADGNGCRRAGHLLLPVGQREVRRVPVDSQRTGRRRADRVLRRAGRRRPRLPLVQHLSGAGLHGRRRRVGAGRRAGHHRGDRAPGNRAVHHAVGCSSWKPSR